MNETINYSGGDGSEWISTGPAARRIGVSPTTLRTYAVTGKLHPLVLPSGRLRWSVTDLDAIGRAS